MSIDDKQIYHFVRKIFLLFSENFEFIITINWFPT